MSFRVSAEQASWTIREAAWGFEERILWRGSDAARGTFDRAARPLQPLQRLIQTRLTWPLGDAFRARGAATRRAIAGSAAAIAIAAGAVGAIVSAGDPPSSEPALPAASVTAAPAEGAGLTLQGITPTIEVEPGDKPVPAAPAPKPSAPPAQVAWKFAQAFVVYEVGRSTKNTTATFAATATPELAKALGEDPPRLPADTKVPKAQVLNVVIGETTKKQMTVSVSIVRLRALSEIRLTLTKDGDAWRVAQVLG